MTQHIAPSPEFVDSQSGALATHPPIDTHVNAAEAVAAAAVTPTVIIHEGEKVYTCDEHKLGKVREVTSQHFKVHAPLRKDFWLDTALVVDVDGDTVHVNIDKDHIDSFKLDHPAVGDALLPPEEQMRQRLAMEAELGIQADGLRIHHDDNGSSVESPNNDFEDTERGPDSRWNPETIDTGDDFARSRQLAGTSRSAPEAGPRETWSSTESSPRSEALKGYADHLRQELNYVERELDQPGDSR